MSPKYPLPCILLAMVLGAMASGARGQGMAPSIVVSPASATVCQGDPLTLGVSATGTAPLVHQWRRDGLPIAGATAASFTIPALTAATAGAYDVVVTNAFGSATSQTATITIGFSGAPTVFSVTPNEIPSPWPATVPVRLFGLGFNATTTVRQRSSCEDLAVTSRLIDPFTLEVDMRVTGHASWFFEVRNGGPCAGTASSPAVRTRLELPRLTGTRPSRLPAGGGATNLTLLGPGIDLVAARFATRVLLDGVPLPVLGPREVLVPAQLLATARLADLQIVIDPSAACPPTLAGLGGNALLVRVAPAELTIAEGTVDGGLALDRRGLPPTAEIFTAFSSDPANRSAPGLGIWFGLHVDVFDLLDQFAIPLVPFRQFADASGRAAWSSANRLLLPGVPGLPLYAQASALDATGTSIVAATDVDGIVVSGTSELLVRNTGILAGPDRNAVITDLDGDGQADLASGLGVWSGAAGPALGARIDGSFPGVVHASGDLDGDGFQDLVVSGSLADPTLPLSSPGGITGGPQTHGLTFLLFGDGTGRFGRTGQRVNTLNEGVHDDGCVRIADLDADGDQDLVVTSGSTWSTVGPVTPRPAGLHVLLNDGQGGFTTSFSGLARTTAAAIGDLDGDGNLDIAAASDLDTLLFVPGDGMGGFDELAATVIATGPGAESAWLEVTDLDGDGRQDLAWCGWRHKGAWVWRATGFQFRDGGAVQAQEGRLPRLALADVNDDGHLDLVGPLVLATGGAIGIAFNDGSGGFRTRAARRVASPEPGAILAADLDGDGDQDLLVTGSPATILENLSR